MNSAIMTDKMIVREVRLKMENPKTYTGGEKDPELLTWFVVTAHSGKQTGTGECLPTSLLYPDAARARAHGASQTNEWNELIAMCKKLLGKDAQAGRSFAF